ncbi:hypothetical protein Tco_0644037 [Tanacetum coccineum]
MLWGIITRINIDYAELMWEEFIQAIQTFLADKANLGIATKKNKKAKPHVIPYCRFTKLIICYLGRTHNIHQRSGSPFNMVKDDHRFGNLKFIPEDEEDEHDHKVVVAEGGKKKSSSKTDQSKKPVTAKKLKPVPSKQSKPAPAKQLKPVKEKSIKVYPIKKATKVKAHGQAPVSGVAFLEPTSGFTQKLPIVEGKGKGLLLMSRRIPVTEAAPTGPSTQPKDDTSANIVRDTLSPTDAETGVETDKTNNEGDIEILNIGEEQGEDVVNKVNLEEKTVEINEGQAGSDPSKTPESRPPPERVLLEEDQAGPDPG